MIVWVVVVIWERWQVSPLIGARIGVVVAAIGVSKRDGGLGCWCLVWSGLGKFPVQPCDADIDCTSGAALVGLDFVVGLTLVGSKQGCWYSSDQRP